MKNKITNLFGIKYPVIQAGMIWCSGWQLASSVSNAGGLGLLGAGSMYPDVLREQIRKCKAATDNPFGVNVPLLYPNIQEIMDVILDENVKIVFTSAGNPNTWTQKLKENGIIVVHVVSSAKFALKSQDAGVDAVVAEGFEAGGHNGREETTTMCLIPMVKDKIKIPLIAAGGIATGRAMMAAFSLGADGVQIGSRFIASDESSAHINFKNKVIDTNEGDTILTLKQLTPVRLIKNEFCQNVLKAEAQCASAEELKQILGRARAKKGMFEGDMTEGELEVGQVAGLIHQVKPAGKILEEIMAEFELAKSELKLMSF